jgi:hypothetical protein
MVGHRKVSGTFGDQERLGVDLLEHLADSNYPRDVTQTDPVMS